MKYKFKKNNNFIVKFIIMLICVTGWINSEYSHVYADTMDTEIYQCYISLINNFEKFWENTYQLSLNEEMEFKLAQELPWYELILERVEESGIKSIKKLKLEINDAQEKLDKLISYTKLVNDKKEILGKELPEEERLQLSTANAKILVLKDTICSDIKMIKTISSNLRKKKRYYTEANLRLKWLNQQKINLYKKQSMYKCDVIKGIMYTVHNLLSNEKVLMIPKDMTNALHNVLMICSHSDFSKKENLCWLLIEFSKLNDKLTYYFESNKELHEKSNFKAFKEVSNNVSLHCRQICKLLNDDPSIIVDVHIETNLL